MTIAQEAGEAFARAFGTPAQGIAFAPGRVNLIGDHVDYCDGFVLPMPLVVGTAVAWRRRRDNLYVVRAADFGGEEHAFAHGDIAPDRSGWRSLVHGMIALLHAEGVVGSGLDLLIRGDLPRGAGLSSSASLCIAIGRAVLQAAGETGFDPVRLARVAQQVEHRFAGVACGIMDQMVIAAGEPGSAMLLDCRSLAHDRVSLPADWSVLIVQSGVSRELIDGEYNARRAQCERAARELGVTSLRDAEPTDADFSALDPVDAKRARHVVGEIARTRAAADAIARGAIGELGALMRASHASMRDDFEASHPEVDHLVDRLNAMIGTEGGARMTGGGFGGAIVAICRAPELTSVLESLGNFAGRNGAKLQTMRAIG